MPTLIFENGPDRGSGLELEPGRTYQLGRDPRCDIVVRDDMVSRHHCKIKEFKGAWYVKDQGSSNGVLLNDHRVKQAEIGFGDQLRFGDAVLSFLEENLDQVRSEHTLGGYRLHQRLGRGGMGTVFAAVQISLNREVALKVLSPHLVQDSNFVQRFQQEARAAGQLNHPHIVSVYDVGHEDGTYYYSMEYIEGGSLEDRLRQEGKIPPEEALEMLHQAAMALEYAESHHIVYRDIKPDNLMLTTDGRIKIADLGLALSMKDGERHEDQPILGTPHFISPEQALRREVDARSDIYSLGATAYRMLSGRTLFEGNSAEQIIRKAVREEPAPLREHEPEVPERLAAVVHRMLEKDPDDRYESARELREELESLQSTPRKLLLLGSFAGVALIAIGIAIFLWARGPQQQIVTVEKDSSATELFASLDEVDRLEVMLGATRALMDILLTDESPELRLATLTAWLDKYQHIETDEVREAQGRVAVIDARLQARRDDETTRLAQREARIQKIRERSSGLREDGDWIGAALAARELDPEHELNEDERSDLIRTRNVLVKACLEAAEDAFEDWTQQVRDRIDAGDWAKAIACCDEAAPHFPPALEALGDVLSVVFASYHEWFPNERARCLTAMESSRDTRYRTELRRVVEAFGDGLRTDLLNLSFGAAASRLEDAGRELSLPGYQDLVLPVLQRLRRGDAVLSRLFAGLDDGSFKDNPSINPPFRLPNGSEGVTLASYDTATATFRVRIPQGALGSRSSDAHFADFAHPQGIKLLLLARFDLEPEAQVDLLGLMIVLQCAIWAETLAPLVPRLEQYDPEAGFPDALRLEILPTTHRPLQMVLQPLIKGLRDQADPDDLAALTREAREETLCHEELMAAMSPFLTSPPVRLGWSESAQRLRGLFEQHRDTLLLRFTYSMLHDGTEFPLADG